MKELKTFKALKNKLYSKIVYQRHLRDSLKKEIQELKSEPEYLG